jgi:hypothetical protein
VEFLSMILGYNKVMMDPIKLARIRDWPTLTTVKQTQSFLGFCNFYRKFIAQYSTIARPLIDLTKKDEPWLWSPPQISAFETLKQKFAETPILQIPDPSKQFFLEADASKWATGVVLCQRDHLSELHPCGYLSKSLSPTEWNYQIYDRELLAIIQAFKEWHYLLLGAPHQMMVHTDHLNLTYHQKPQDLTP